MADPKFTEQLGYLIARANRLIEEDLSKRLQSNGIAIEQYRVLKSLEEEGPLPMGRLAERVLVEPATLTKIIDRMVRDNLVFRVPDEKDRRKVRVALSASGVAICRQLEGIGDDHEKHIAETLGEGELKDVRRILFGLGT
ncbi:MarR family winged helix-turn-helix transcriptional regulator [Salipiger bermudensis]|uniref:Transcriptional regulatory protein n=1 Tax=Salipiger bermudensis (strain DSM 26914 / JCM 13377 / KCTC 12554 / HTCC2601) TaxID=314265 RepID=Q0FRN0_SALBH|nr:MarR family transcriptional regulator [Salipiger bermudensis]EAU46824.1 transcriptional regulatory protein [Salipiger bermudensis HTCC2601]MAE89786.1 MarR family transcriptional regulator [Pelagibaca sp.]MBN9676042.1 MarR family transcriptional regulator [Salipiger bermudensis]MCA1287838.1 MarR family transcriptional regulator [Salipiger bermudensis]